MKTIKQLYRHQYTGENVVVNLAHEGGQWNSEVEWIPNAVFTSKTTTQAVVIGNGVSRLGFDLNLLTNHKGGLLGRNKLQTYGCNALYRDFKSDFLVAVGNKIVAEIAELSSYTTNNIVYTNATHMLDYPKQFYLVPQDPTWNAGAIAAYLACFDGHKKVFLLGHDGFDSPGSNNVYLDTNGYPSSEDIQSEAFWVATMFKVMTTYPEVQFIRVMPTPNHYVPDMWKPCANFSQIDFRGFSLMADI